MLRSFRRVRIGLFEVDFQASRVSRQGRRIVVQDQPFRLLTMLLDKPGEIVTREEIRASLWPADTYVSFDDGLNTAIRKLRVVFRDSADNPRFIETVPRSGYRFIAPVTDLAEEARALGGSAEVSLAANNGEYSVPLPAPVGTPITALPTPATSRILRVALAGALFVAAVAVFLFRPALPPPRVTHFTQLTNDGHAKATMVTDGARVYFSYSGFVNSLYQVSTAGGDTVPLQLPVTDPIVIDISPDRSKLLVWSCSSLDDSECPLWTVPVLGGAARPVGTTRSSLLAVDRDGRGRSPDAAWSPDGKELLYVHDDGLYRANIDGSGARVIFHSANGESIYWPRWSPDETHGRFSLGIPNLANSIWEVTADGTNPHPLLAGWNSPPSECCGSWTSDGQYFVFQSKRGGAANIWAIREKSDLLRRAARQPIELTTGPTSTYSPLPSPDGKRLFVLTTQARGELMRFDSASRQVAPYFSGTSTIGLSFSADGRRVTYVTYPEGTLWRSNSDGSEKIQLTFPPLFAVQPRWSPDGRHIAFMGEEPGKPWSIFVVSADGGSPDQPVPADYGAADPNWSSDGNSLLFGRSPGDGSPMAEPIYLETVNLRTRLISRVPGSQNLWSPRWSSDCRQVLALARSDRKLTLFDIKTRRRTALADVAAGYPEWSRNGDYAYFVSIPPRDQPRAVVRVRIRDGKIEQLMTLKDFRQATGWGDWFGLGPDDSPLLLRDAGTQDIYALEWEAP